MSCVKCMSHTHTMSYSCSLAHIHNVVYTYTAIFTAHSTHHPLTHDTFYTHTHTAHPLTHAQTLRPMPTTKRYWARHQRCFEGNTTSHQPLYRWRTTTTVWRTAIPVKKQTKLDSVAHPLAEGGKEQKYVIIFIFLKESWELNRL